MAAVLNPSCCVAAAALAELMVFLSLALRLLNQTWTLASVNLVLEEFGRKPDIILLLQNQAPPPANQFPKKYCFEFYWKASHFFKKFGFSQAFLTSKINGNFFYVWVVGGGKANKKAHL